MSDQFTAKAQRRKVQMRKRRMGLTAQRPHLFWGIFSWRLGVLAVKRGVSL
jgi:hypothetical protein